MLGTRRASKRLSQKKVEENNLQGKKRKVQSRKSLYFDPGGSDEDTDCDTDSSKNDIIEMEADSTTQLSKNKDNSNLRYDIKNENLSESESSSDEFKKAPFSLDELGDFEVYKKEDLMIKKQLIQNGESLSVSRFSNDSDVEDKPKLNSEYYDFSQIIKTQELITTMKKEFDEVKYEEQEPSTSKVSLQNLKEKKVKAKRKPLTTKRTNNESNKIKSGVNDLDVSQLLAMAEGVSLEQNEDESDVSDQENDVTEHSIPKDGVEITIQLPNMRQKKKSTIDVEAAMKRRINLVRKENQVLMHKVHLLCWIAHGNYLNDVLNNDDLMGLALSLIPSQHCYPPKHTNLNYLEKLVEWFIKKISVNEEYELKSSNITILLSLQAQIKLKIALSQRDLVLVFVSMLRSLGIHARLIISLRAVPLKPPASELFVVSTKPETEGKDQKNKTQKSLMIKTPDNRRKSTNSKSIKKSIDKIETGSPSKTSKTKTSAYRRRILINTDEELNIKEELNSSQYFSSSDEKPLKKINQIKTNSSEYFCSSEEKPLKNKVNENRRNSSQYFNSDEKPLKNKGGLNTNKANNSQYFSSPNEGQLNKKVNALNKSSTSNSPNKTKGADCKPMSFSIKGLQRERKSTPKSYIEPNTSSSEDDIKYEKPSSKKLMKTKTENRLKSAGNKLTPKKRGSTSNSISKKITFDEADDDFEPSSLKKQSKPGSRKSIDRRVLSSDDEKDDGYNKKIGVDYWAEIFLEEEEKWISVDLTKGRVHCVHKIYNLATHPVRYILAWNNDKSIKDITRKYTPHWLTVTRKQRIEQNWWDETLAPYAPCKTAREKEEDEDLDRQLHDTPLPTSITEYKNHPLYALSRHLLKFEAIYPADAPPVGFVRGEPVYSRGCVSVLHAKESWIREAKCVRIGEEPYKIVKARPKYDKLSGNVINNLPLPLFGHWQVEDYMAPPAVDGKVPRNEYGNVELYKPCMLPPGTVHLQLPSLNRVARKLNIDCAPAVVGWEFHGGGSYPVLDGFIVCEEFKETLLDAWNQEIDESARRAKEKVEQRVYGNWRRLIKGLLIRERLKLRYDFGPVSSEPEKTKKKTSRHGHRKSK